MPLIVEFRCDGRWCQVGPALSPDLRIDVDRGVGTGGGSMSHNGPAGRQVYWFGCVGEHSVILRSVGGGDREIGPFRHLNALAGFEEIARLDASSPTFECWLITDRMREPTLVRFRHQ